MIGRRTAFGLLAGGAVSLSVVMTALPAASAVLADPPAEAMPPEVRWRLFEAAVVDALRQEHYFGDAIRARLEQKASLGEEARRAARTIGWSDAEGRAAIKRLDAREGRASLATLVPSSDDPVIVRQVILDDLLRAIAPAGNASRITPKSHEHAVAAAIKLLHQQMPLPGDAAIWGKVDTELDRKIRSLLASRAPREQMRTWCEFAAWTMLAQGLNERALGVAEASAKWIADAKQPASVELAAVQTLALVALDRKAEAKSALAVLEALQGAPPPLLARVRAAVAR